MPEPKYDHAFKKHWKVERFVILFCFKVEILSEEMLDLGHVGVLRESKVFLIK